MRLESGRKRVSAEKSHASLHGRFWLIFIAMRDELEGELTTGRTQHLGWRPMEAQAPWNDLHLLGAEGAVFAWLVRRETWWIYILRVLTRAAVDISDTKNIDVTALRDAVQALGAPGFGTTGESGGSLSGGSSESCGEEKSGDGEELHLD